MHITSYWKKSLALLVSANLMRICWLTAHTIKKTACALAKYYWWLILLPMASLCITFFRDYYELPFECIGNIYFMQATAGVLLLCAGWLSTRLYWWPLLLIGVELGAILLFKQFFISLDLFTNGFFLFLLFVISRLSEEIKNRDAIAHQLYMYTGNCLVLAFLFFIKPMVIFFLVAPYIVYGIRYLITRFKGLKYYSYNLLTSEIKQIVGNLACIWYALAVFFLLDDKEYERSNEQKLTCLYQASNLFWCNLPIFLIFAILWWGVVWIRTHVIMPPIFACIKNFGAYRHLIIGLTQKIVFVITYLVGVSLLSVLYAECREKNFPSWDGI